MILVEKSHLSFIMSLISALPGIFLVVKMRLWVLGRETTETRHHSHSIIPGVPALKLPQQCWSSILSLVWGWAWPIYQCKIIFLFSTLSTWDVPIWDQCMASRGFGCTFFRLKHLHQLFGILHEGCTSHSLIHLLIYQHGLTTMSVSCILFCNLRMHFYYADQVVLVLPIGSLFCWIIFPHITSLLYSLCFEHPLFSGAVRCYRHIFFIICLSSQMSLFSLDSSFFL